MIGRLLRQQMQDAADQSPERTRERIAARAAGEQANREMMEKFAPLTAENVAEAMKWQEARIKELT